MVFGGCLQQSSREGSGAALPSCGWGSCKFCPCGVCRRFPFEHALIFFRRFKDIWFDNFDRFLFLVLSLSHDE